MNLFSPSTASSKELVLSKRKAGSWQTSWSDELATGWSDIKWQSFEARHVYGCGYHRWLTIGLDGSATAQEVGELAWSTFSAQNRRRRIIEGSMRAGAGEGRISRCMCRGMPRYVFSMSLGQLQDRLVISTLWTFFITWQHHAENQSFHLIRLHVEKRIFDDLWSLKSSLGVLWSCTCAVLQFSIVFHCLSTWLYGMRVQRVDPKFGDTVQFIKILKSTMKITTRR